MKCYVNVGRSVRQGLQAVAGCRQAVPALGHATTVCGDPVQLSAGRTGQSSTAGKPGPEAAPKRKGVL